MFWCLFETHLLSYKVFFDPCFKKPIRGIQGRGFALGRFFKFYLFKKKKVFFSFTAFVCILSEMNTRLKKGKWKKTRVFILKINEYHVWVLFIICRSSNYLHVNTPCLKRYQKKSRNLFNCLNFFFKFNFIFRILSAYFQTYFILFNYVFNFNIFIL